MPKTPDPPSKGATHEQATTVEKTSKREMSTVSLGINHTLKLMINAHFGQPGTYSHVGYQCAGCQLICKGFDNYKSHFNATHENIKNVCKVCYVVFTNETTLKEHVKELELLVKVQEARDKSAKNVITMNTLVHAKDLIVANEEEVVSEITVSDQIQTSHHGNLSQLIKFKYNKKQISADKIETVSSDRSIKNTRNKNEAFDINSTLLENTSAGKKLSIAKTSVSKTTSSPKTLETTRTKTKSQLVHLERGEIDRRSIMLKQINVMPNQENKSEIESKIRVKNATSSFDIDYLAAQLTKKIPVPRRQRERDPNVARFACHHCSHRFASRTGLANHMRLHTGKFVTCDICFKKFPNAGGLKYHKLSHTKVKEFQCTVCDMYLTTKQGLKQHNLRHQTHFNCTKCGKPFPTQQALLDHSKIHLTDLPPPKTFKCTLCDKVFSKSTTVKQHIKRIHFDDRPFKCEICDKSFKTKSEVVAHVKIHQEDRQFVEYCDLCDQGFYKKQALNNHNLRKHTLNAPKCSLCSRIFDNVEARDAHVANHPPYTTKEKRFQCPHCNLKFKTNGNLQAHISCRHDINNLTCSICDKIFASKRDLLFHKNSSHSEFVLKCAMCDTEFTNMKELQDHEQSHLDAGAVSFKCGQCDESFLTLKKFHLHREIHEFNPKFVCVYCEKNCKSKVMLDGHLKVHETGARLCCMFCYSWFEMKISLEQHMISKHIRSGKMVRNNNDLEAGGVKCPRCFKTFESNDLLEKHLENHPYVLELDILNNRVTCNVCEATFKTPALLKQHEESHYVVEDDTETYVFDEDIQIE